jgi:tetratricopeptide (TPR) repeat protein
LPSLAAQRRLEPVRLTKLVRGELDWIVMKCLEKDRSRRYDTASGLARDVERYLADEMVEARPASAGYRLRKFVRRNKGRVIAGGAFAALLFLVVGLVLYGIWWAHWQSAERRHEQALIAARDNAAFKATLDQAEAALKSGRLTEAGTLLDQAGRQFVEQTPTDLRDRHARLEKEERTVRELNDIFEERWMISRSDTRLDNTRAKRRYPLIFQRYGLAVGTEPAAATEAKIRQSPITEALSVGMTEWFFVDPKYPGLLAVVDLLDPDVERTTLRAAIARGDTDRINEIGKTVDGSRLPPPYAVGLVTYAPACDDLRMLKAAWTSHPDSFALILAISGSGQLDLNDKLRTEAAGWGRTAVALRPSNALAHYYLGLALRHLSYEDKKHLVPAIAEFRRAIELAPRFVRAHGQLAAALQDDHNPEALASARTAIELDEKNVDGHLVLLADLRAKKNFVEAEKLWRRIAGLSLREEDEGPEGDYAAWRLRGCMTVAAAEIPEGLMRAGRPYRAYRFHVDFGGSDPFNPAAAALAGTGQGLDAPPPAERPAIRKYALEWLTTTYCDLQKHALVFPSMCAGAAGSVGAPLGDGPFLAAAAFLAGAAWAPDRAMVHQRMNQWLGDADLAGVRNDEWLAKLPADERDQWRKFWSEVRALRDRTAPPKTATPSAGK